MRLIIAPLVIGPRGELRPNLPSEIVWAQASDCYNHRGRTLVWSTCSDQEAEAISELPGFDVRGNLMPGNESRQMLSAMRTDNIAKDEFIAAYRQEAKAHEQAEQIRKLAILAGRLSIGVFLNILAFKYFGGDVAMATTWALLHSDDFNRADSSGDYADIDGSTFSDGLGLWDRGTGTYSYSLQIRSNKIVCDRMPAQPALGGVFFYEDRNASSAMKDQRTEITYVAGFYNRGHGLITRGDASLGNGYNGSWIYGAGINRIYKMVNGNFLHTELAAVVGPAYADGDIWTMESEGTSHTTYVNGSVMCGPATDSTYASGRPGYCTENTEHNFDNFKIYKASVSTPYLDADQVLAIKRRDGYIYASIFNPSLTLTDVNNIFTDYGNDPHHVKLNDANINWTATECTPTAGNTNIYRIGS